MSAPGARRTKDELLLLLVSGMATVVAVVFAWEAAPDPLALWLATAAALALALTGLFAFWFGGAARRRLEESLHAESEAVRNLLSAIPDGLILVRDGEICSVNRSLCELLGYEREQLLGTRAPFPFWPPEHRHDVEAWHADLVARGELTSELTFRRRQGDRVRLLASGCVVDDQNGLPRHLITLRDVSTSHRRMRRLTELAARDPETGLLDRREFEERLGDAVRRAIQGGTNVTVVLADLAVHGRVGDGVFGRPEAHMAVERLSRLARAGDELARTDDGELGWILPETDAAGGIDAVARWRNALGEIGGVVLTAGVCDLAGAGDAFSLYALADRALVAARRSGPGSTERHVQTVLPERRAAV
jgi:PAS domain S-box-containing protein